MPLLSAEGLDVRVGERQLVADLSLHLDAEERVALVGPSGSGKTTILRALAGLHPAAGELRLEGRAPQDWGWPVYRRRVAYLAQRAHMVDGTVADNLALSFAFASAEGASLDEGRAAEMLQALRLDRDVMDEPARRLSEGERQRVALVRTLLVEPPVLLLDEPTSALDEASAKAVEQLVTAQCGDGRAVLLVSHDAAQRERFATRTIAMPGQGDA